MIFCKWLFSCSQAANSAVRDLICKWPMSLFRTELIPDPEKLVLIPDPEKLILVTD